MGQKENQKSQEQIGLEHGRERKKNTQKRISPESNSKHHSEEALEGSFSHFCLSRYVKGMCTG